MDVKSQNESYRKWQNGEVMVMIATSAFGRDIRQIIRYGVPENVRLGTGTRQGW